MHYIINGTGAPEPCTDLTKWSEWYLKHGHDGIIDDRLPNGLRLKTAFVGRDIDGEPIMWETQAIIGTFRKSKATYSNPQEAAAGHQYLLARASKTSAAKFFQS
jgi:hypothetical protein